MGKFTFRFLIGALITFAMIICVGCSKETQTRSITWINADGSIIATETVAVDYNPLTRALPEDCNDWHYTGWQLSHSGAIIECSATRVAKQHFVW